MEEKEEQKEPTIKSSLIYGLGKLVEFNDKKEGEAIEEYMELLKYTAESSLEQDDKDHIASVINEIISDELNHQQKLHTLFTTLTGIKTDKD